MCAWVALRSNSIVKQQSKIAGSDRVTESRNPASQQFDQLPTIEMVRLMNREDARVPVAIAETLPAIAQAVDLVADVLTDGNRCFLMGAGTSGRLCVLDAVELGPTFRLEPGRVVPLLAGGSDAMLHSSEGREDEGEQGKADLATQNFGPDDILLAVAASGSTPYALAGIEYASAVGARTIALVCNRDSAMAAAADLAIEVIVGAEVITGSTRLKAGTAQKMVLNMISTCVMTKLGKVYGNLMVDVHPTNEKLRQRAVRIVSEATGKPDEVSYQLLIEADWEVKTAVMMGLTDADASVARQTLRAASGFVRLAEHNHKDR